MPDEPGVYLMKDRGGEVIYIGKASSLRKRVNSYFQKGDLDPKTRVLVKQIDDIEYIVTDSEIEALILESNLVKKNKPKYNIRLKDDKRYPYLAITLDEDYPRVVYTRSLKREKNRYFGPYTDARAARNTMAMINNIFKLKRCRRELPLKDSERPCLNYQMKRCSGICVGDITREEYLSLVENAARFLEGNMDPVIENLNSKMKGYSENFEYEKAAVIRDMIFDIQKVSEEQKVSVPVGMDQDYLAVSIFRDEAVLLMFQFRKGVLIGRKITVFENAGYTSPEEILRTFILDHYREGDVPQRIVAHRAIPEKEIIEKHLTEKFHKKTVLSLPVNREEQGIVNMIKKNIDLLAAERTARQEFLDTTRGLEELREALGLDAAPETMECFDISNLQGKDAVASMVSFRGGLPEKSGYRRYRIRGYGQANDPGMIHEVVSRRVQYLANEGLPFPDLMIIDGGKTQLARAVEAAGNFTGEITIISLAKRFEEIYTSPGLPPLRLPADSPGLKILQNIRDEAHRFAVAYHRKLRDRKTTGSVLDETGVSDRVKKILLDEFKSLDAIKEADVEALRAVKGIGNKTAEKIHGFFNERGG